MGRISAVAGLLAVGLVAGCGAGASTSPPSEQTSAASLRANVVGVVLAGPRCPVVQAGTPCPDTPVVSVVVTFTPATGGTATSVTTAADGSFSVGLAPGDYVALVRADPAKGVMSAKPETVTVPASGTVDVTLHGDTGIR